jgi:hypothetical protein
MARLMFVSVSMAQKPSYFNLFFRKIIKMKIRKNYKKRYKKYFPCLRLKWTKRLYCYGLCARPGPIGLCRVVVRPVFFHMSRVGPKKPRPGGHRDVKA